VLRRILVVEDEMALAIPLGDRLRGEGYEVELAGDGDTALRQGMTNTFDLILLDIMLPRRSGLEVCRELRQNGIHAPVLMLTARGQITDKVTGFQLGADDYLAKPFDMRELLARISALLRRVPTRTGEPLATYRFGTVEVDLKRSTVMRDGAPVTLSTKEFQLLRHLIERRGVIHSREDLLAEVWGYDSATQTRTVDVHILWLRQKLETDPKAPEFILTIRGRGYKFTG
jgi:two-component system alkaline phosphatase synthesis response regulator PhoP